ncbi:MAG TPA: CpaF family protein [Acidimicrobiia bacterium]|nr:CpaF family protein [Acidimicrobiia bacterium]
MTATLDRALRDSVHRRLLASPFDPRAVSRDALRAEIGRILRDEAPLCPHDEARRLVDVLVDEVGGLGPLERWLDDPTVTEIMVNGPGRAYVERAGRLEPIDLPVDGPTIARLVDRVVAPLGLRLDHASPMVDARLPDGSRLHAVLPPLAPDGPCVTIRRFTVRDATLATFGVDAEAAVKLRALVRCGWNLLVAGATSAGKTTLCNTLAASIEAGDRIVTIEETAELRLPQPHVVRLEARPANAEGVGAVGVRDLVRAALRMRPDRLVVGEVRGGEALDMLQALNTGHDGSLSTIHANGPDEALARLETLALLGGVALPLSAIRAQIGAAVDGVVQVRRTGDGTRVVTAVAEVDPTGTSTRPLLERRNDALCACGAPARPARRLALALREAWS